MKLMLFEGVPEHEGEDRSTLISLKLPAGKIFRMSAPAPASAQVITVNGRWRRVGGENGKTTPLNALPAAASRVRLTSRVPPGLDGRRLSPTHHRFQYRGKAHTRRRMGMPLQAVAFAIQLA